MAITTRKQAHAQAIEFLAQAAEAMDQAHAQLRDAMTLDAVIAGSGPYRTTARRASIVLDDLLKAARQAACDDCGVLIAACQCQWSNEGVA